MRSGTWALPLLPLLLACPARTRPPPPEAAAACAAGRADAARLRRDVATLALDFLPRDADHPANLDRAADWVARSLREAGAPAVREQPFAFRGVTCRNVIADFGPETPERVVVGAHYDAAGPFPGADDNASGVAGLLELARLLAANPPPLRVELVAYTLEEPPAFGTESMGSAHHARALAATGARVRLMISLEMIGTFSDAEGSQRYPVATKRLLYPTRGNFIAVLGQDGDAVGTVGGAMAAASPLPVETLAGPPGTPGIDLSDNRSYWNAGFPAVMVTDTANYRNPRYHTDDDRPERLDHARMAQVVSGVHCAVQALARRSTGR
jgi:hypothetical protein